MKTAEIQKLSPDELKSKLEHFKKELFNLRFQKEINQLENFMRIKTTKKIIARILTVMNQKKS